MRTTPEPLLSLSSIFTAALAVLDDGVPLRVPPLPAAVFMMQRDVINHYRHALTHYLCIPLDSHFLQGSSLGSPYVKWAKFTNEDFESLSFTINSLLRYTGRLVHERSPLNPLNRQSDFGLEAFPKSLSAIRPSARSIGVRIEPDCVVITPFVRDKVVTHRYSTNKREILHTLQQRGLHELELLNRLNLDFAERVRARQRDVPTIEVFDLMYQEWCM